MTAAKKGDQVVVDFDVKTQEGRAVGSTSQEGPMTLTLGEGSLFPKVEEALIGMEAGEKKEVVLGPDDAFGQRRQELVIKIPRENLPKDREPEPGMQLSAQGPNGQNIALIIVQVEGDAVMADGNHPLAGHDLTFDLTLVEIKQAA